MAGMGLSGGFAAGAGADALEDLLKRLFVQQTERKRASQEDERIKIDQQRANDATELRKLDQEARAQDRTDRAALQSQTGAIKLRGQLRPKQAIGPETIAALTKGGFGEDVVAPTLSSRNIGAGLTSSPNPGRGPSFAGTPEQLDEQAQGGELDRQIAMAAPQLRGRLSMVKLLPADKRSTAISEVMREEAKPTSQPVMRIGRGGKMENIGDAPAGAHFVNEPAPPTQQLITVQTVDADGNKVTKVVPKTAGSEFKAPKAANAALDNRLASARVVNEVGDNMIQKLSDPAFAAVVGPAMGRAGTLRDFIGNPPPQFSELAGQIESYALANMGVHGMRSAQGAEQIKHLLDQHHTPQSLAATIRGLNEFSTRLVKDSGPKDTTDVGAKETPEARLKRLMSGG